MSIILKIILKIKCYLFCIYEFNLFAIKNDFLKMWLNYDKIILKLIIIVTLTFIGWYDASSQNPTNRAIKWNSQNQYGIHLLNVGIGMPHHPVNGRIQPGLYLSLNHPIKLTKLSKYDYELGFGYFAQQALQRASFISLGLGRKIELSRKLHFRPAISHDLMLVRNSNDEFRFISGGKYQKVSPYRFQQRTSIGMSLGCRLAQLKKYNISTQIGYQFGVQYPFSNLSGILPLNQISFALLLNLNNKK
jgi:hypothetical protein